MNNPNCKSNNSKDNGTLSSSKTKNNKIDDDGFVTTENRNTETLSNDIFNGEVFVKSIGNYQAEQKQRNCTIADNPYFKQTKNCDKENLNGNITNTADKNKLYIKVAIIICIVATIIVAVCTTAFAVKTIINVSENSTTEINSTCCNKDI